MADRDRVKIRERNPRVADRCSHRGQDRFDMGAACDLGDHAAILRVQVVLTGDE